VTDLGVPRHPVGLAVVAAISLMVAACAGDGGTAAPPGDARVATFQVVGGEQFRVLLTERLDLDVAGRLLAGEDAPSIPNGLVVRGDTSVNAGYSWSIDPNDFAFADVTIEVCDGLPSDVEQGLVTSDRYCPWSAIIVSLEPAP